MFTPEELQNLAVFMSRVDLTGKESTAHAHLMNKISQELDKADVDLESVDE